MSKIKIKTGDQVKVIAGKDKGKEGKVLQVFPRLNRVVVEGVNASKRHLKVRRADQKGQIVEFFMPLHISNVQPLGSDGKQVRHDDKPKTL
ncbi:MAG: 50S ribosomal protein L24 [Patescibacteria group bacterium]